jgi:15,16-dihydrobiliverdin:ferredoxin oxidoreductase
VNPRHLLDKKIERYFLYDHDLPYSKLSVSERNKNSMLSSRRTVFLLRFLFVQCVFLLSAHAWLSARTTRTQKVTNSCSFESPRSSMRNVCTTRIDLRASSLRVLDQTMEQPIVHPMSVEEVEHLYGMPWRSSIDPSYEYDSLFYMPFWEWQLAFMKENLTNLRVLPTVERTSTQKDLTYVENIKKKKRMITLCFASDEYRLIRMTLLDAGTATKVFTSLWYPRGNLPVLGIDFLQFNHQKRHLTVVDMQPIHSSEDDHDLPYEHLLDPIRKEYPSLQNTMSDRFYDENQFFSSQMLLGRGDQPDYVWSELMPAYKAYVQTHLHLVKGTSTQPPKFPSDIVLQQHKAYDDYSSVRDPAHGLLAAIFGKEYADAFVYDVLFPLSDEAPAPSLNRTQGR